MRFSHYDETGTPFLWVFLVVGVLTLAGPILGGLLPFKGWLIYGGFASLFAFVLSACAWSTWGCETLTVDARMLVIGRGLGRWRWERRRIDRRRVRSVELVRLPRSRGKGRNLPGFVLRFLLEDGVVIDFGFGLDYRTLHHAARWLGEVAKVP